MPEERKGTETMTNQNDGRDSGSEKVHARRSIVTGMGVAVAGLAATVTAQAQTDRRRRRGEDFEPARHDIDAWLGEVTGSHRIFIDSATPNGGAEALLYGNNLFSAQTGAYDGSDSDLSIVICFRHFSTPFGFGDAIWSKYGDAINEIIGFPDPKTNRAPNANLMNVSGRTDLPNGGVTIDAVTSRGAQFAICNAATQFFTGQLANQTGRPFQEIYDELVAGAIPASRFVPAGVMALTRAQEYGYSLLVAG
jgi:hypothetical protein